MVITLALLISLVEVVIALPSHLASRKKSKKLEPKKRHQLIENFRNQYEVVLKVSLKRKYLLVLSFIFLFFGTLLFFAFAARAP